VVLEYLFVSCNTNLKGFVDGCLAEANKNSSYGVTDGQVILYEYMNVNICICYGQTRFCLYFLWGLNFIQFVQLCSPLLFKAVINIKDSYLKLTS
jgi:hypothetical protein